MKKIISIILTAAVLASMSASLTGCAKEVKAENLMEGISGSQISVISDLSSGNQAVTDFAIRLFQATAEQGADANTLISPLSVLCALAMTANGAKGETLSQMETVLGMQVEDLNAYLYSYVQGLPQGEKYQLRLANSIWFTEDDRFTVQQDFLQTNADYYGADVFKAPFDKSTVRDINSWVNDKTDKMIPKILDNISDEAVMYLINALAFEAEWQSTYKKYQVEEGIFTLADGQEKKADFMYSTEYAYLEDDLSTGFIKYYKGESYAFVALLPNEDVTMADYTASLNGAHISALLSNPEREMVYAAIPKFETAYSVEMKDMLAEMGMPDGFDIAAADFSGLGSSTAGNIYISQVLHKTFISVGEKGTKAGAVTVVVAGDGAAVPEEPKTVYLDRPFVYMLIDCENNVPFFIGTMMDVSK